MGNRKGRESNKTLHWALVPIISPRAEPRQSIKVAPRALIHPGGAFAHPWKHGQVGRMAAVFGLNVRVG